MSVEHMPGSKEHLMGVADEVIPTLDSIASAAHTKLSMGLSGGPDSLINPSDTAVAHLGEVQFAVRESYRKLTEEPAIARVVTITEQDETRTYYICRVAPVSGIKNLASYRAPIGRLASLAIGSELELPNGAILEVRERAELRPVHSASGWDSLGTVLESDGFGPVTIASLQALRTGAEGEQPVKDLVAELLQATALDENVAQGVRRNLITKMELRDQPLLDQYQDEIFRLPLDSRLLLLGPPGTGKTTTLIRRLGQKLDVDFLDDEEREIVTAASVGAKYSHAQSWLMFTPTELLRQYLKEAFAREEVPAPDLRITTWTDHRRELSKHTFGVLRSAGGGTFVLKDDVETLNANATEQPIEWFEDFSTWQQGTFRQSLLDASSELSRSNIQKVRQLGEHLHTRLSGSTGSTLAVMFALFEAESDRVGSIVQSLKDSSNAKIREALNQQLNVNRAFATELAAFLENLQQAATASTDGEEPEDEDDDDEPAPRTATAAALRAYERAVRTQARATASNRAVPKTTRSGKILEWLGSRTLGEADLQQLGLNLLALSNARRFLNPVKRYFDGVSRRYRAFRRVRQQEGQWYLPDSFRAQDLHPLELDGILLSLLRDAGALLSRPNVQRNIENATWSHLQIFREQYRNQILVDEATDFSPLQLACMAALAHPRLRSFFACGDFNQRLTTWGARSLDQLKWIYPEFDVREVTVSYRQSKQLNELARAIIRIAGGTESIATLPAHIDNDGVAPVLLEHADFPSQVKWLADRIRDIECNLGQLPSTGILVNSETDVGPLAEALNTALAEDNIRVMACHEGQSVGSEGSVRVFDIQHIKGLEFEAVFFIGLDELAVRRPELFDKYLYVGITRAATYLGMTCSESIPVFLEPLRAHFSGDWR